MLLINEFFYKNFTLTIYFIFQKFEFFFQIVKIFNVLKLNDFFKT